MPKVTEVASDEDNSWRKTYGNHRIPYYPSLVDYIVGSFDGDLNKVNMSRAKLTSDTFHVSDWISKYFKEVDSGIPTKEQLAILIKNFKNAVFY